MPPSLKSGEGGNKACFSCLFFHKYSSYIHLPACLKRKKKNCVLRLAGVIHGENICNAEQLTKLKTEKAGTSAAKTFSCCAALCCFPNSD